MGKTAQDGPFTPLVVIVRDQLGTKQFNQLRGKAISLHSQGKQEYRFEMQVAAFDSTERALLMVQ